MEQRSAPATSATRGEQLTGICQDPSGPRAGRLYAGSGVLQDPTEQRQDEHGE